MKDASGDDWQKPRTHGEHLTDAEVAQIRDAFVNRYRADYIARKLQCASRTVKKYYSYFRCEGVEQRPRS